MPSASRSPSAADHRRLPVAAFSGDASWFRDPAPFMLFALMFVMCCFPLRDFDFWWHLRTGQLILERGTVPFTDWYTYMDSEQTWIDMHWGFQVLMACVYRLVGTNGVVLLKAAIYSLAVIVGWNATGRNISRHAKIMIWLPAVVAVSGRAYERPEMLTVLFLAVSLLLAEKCRSERKWLWGWPVLIMVWANCHALFILGIFVWCAFAAEALFIRLLDFGFRGRVQRLPSISVSEVVFFSVLVLAAALINPYTSDGLMFPWVLYRKFSAENDFYGARIAEFRAPVRFVQQMMQVHGPVVGILQAIRNLYFTSEVCVFLIGAASFAGPIRRRQFNVYRLLLFAGFSHLAWVATRNTSVFSLVVAVIACANFAESRSIRHPDEKPGTTVSPLGNQLAALGIGLLMVFFMSGEWGHFVESWKVFGFGEAKNWFGHNAAEFCGREGMPDRAFISHIGLAGTWIWHNGPEKKVFMDPRLEVCSRKTFEKHDQVLALMARGESGWEQIINPDHLEMPVVLLDSRYSRVQIFRLLHMPAWRLVFADPSATVFMTTAQANTLSLSPANPERIAEVPD